MEYFRGRNNRFFIFKIVLQSRSGLQRAVVGEKVHLNVAQILKNKKPGLSVIGKRLEARLNTMMRTTTIIDLTQCGL
jgi:hypothetical protein